MLVFAGAAVLLMASCVAEQEPTAQALVEDGELELAPLDRLMVESVEDHDGASPTLPVKGGSGDQPAADILPGFDVSIALLGGDITLSWPDQGQGVTYDVHRSEYPYFAIGGVKGVKLVEGHVGTSYVDVGGGDDTDYFYQVRAHFPANYFEDSTTVGKKVTALHKGYTKIGQCLISEIDTAEELCSDIGDAAISAHMWDEVTQGWTWWWAGTPGPGLTWGTGDVVSINIGHDHPDRQVQLGYVPAEDDVTIELLPGDNLVTVLPARFGDMMASDLLGAVPHATRVGYWDAANQVTNWYPDGADFQIEKCSDVHVEVTQASTWPPPLPPCPCDALPLVADVLDGSAGEIDDCFDEEHATFDPVFAAGEEGFVAGRHHDNSAWFKYKVTVGTLHADYVDQWSLDPSLVDHAACVAYDNRSWQGEVSYQLVSEDEARACEVALRDLNAAQASPAHCLGGS